MRSATGHRLRTTCGGALLILSFGSTTVVTAATGPAANSAGYEATLDAVTSFDRSLLSGQGRNTTDLSRFERGDMVLPGTYSVDLYLNDAAAGRSNVRFAGTDPTVSATPCVTSALLDKLSLRPDVAASTAAALADEHACVDLSSVIPGAGMSFDGADLRLDVSVPQAYLGQRPRGYVDPKYWDDGVSAGLLNYNFNAYRTSSHGVAQTSAYLGLNAGVNLGLWHFRHNSALTWQSAIAGTRPRQRWQNISTFAQRDLPGLRAQWSIGDSWTSGEVFDSIGVRGMQIATDERMLPQSLRGYAPTVRGVANSNARVTVRQNGMVIYQTTVAPGPFSVNDLYATGYGGDLEVSVNEADGRTHTFSVPYASVPQLLRPGVNRFGVAVGQLRDASIQHRPAVAQATLQRGLTNLVTLYGGMNGAPGYAGLLAGGALNTAYGAFALDLTIARAHLPGIDALQGRSLRLSYSKLVAQTGTSLTVAAYRHSTSGFLTLGDAMRARDRGRRKLPIFADDGSNLPLLINGVPVAGLLTPAQQAALLGVDYRDQLTYTGIDRQRDNFSLTLNQRLGERGGTLYLSGSTRDYWNRSGTDTQYQFGYNNTLGRLNYNLAASRERDLLGRSDNRFMINLTIPLGNDTHAPTLTGGVIRENGGATQMQVTVGGTAGVDEKFSYGATATRGSASTVGSAGSVNAGYRGSQVQLAAGFGAGSGFSQASLGASGSVVVHSGGLTLGQPLGDTIGIVSAPDAAGARVSNAAGVRINRAGFAIVPYLTPYVLNTVGLDPSGLPLDVQLDSTSAQVAPRAGAVVLMKFKSESGRFVLIQATLADGATLPFGAEVLDSNGQSVGVVGQAGRIMVRATHDSGRLSVHWQDHDRSQTCSFPYRLQPRVRAGRGAQALEQINATCESPPTAARVAGRDT
jgi:outer membrane usher protein